MEQVQLIEKAMLGDAPALEALVGTYYSSIYAFCCRRAGNEALGADLCQDTFLKMVENLSGYRDRGYFKSWLFTIASNCCRDAHRRHREISELDDTIADTNAAFEEQSENAIIIKNALKQLPEEQAEAVILRYYHDFSMKDIARVQKIPSATAKTRIHRGLKKLKIILGEEIQIET